MDFGGSFGLAPKNGEFPYIKSRPTQQSAGADLIERFHRQTVGKQSLIQDYNWRAVGSKKVESARFVFLRLLVRDLLGSFRR
jgi:hypothetical protein